MLKKILLLLLCLLYSACTRSSMSESQLTKHFLWKVSDSDSYVWILGSIHMADSSFYPLNPVITNAFNESKALVLEIDVSNDSLSGEINEVSMDLGILPSNQTLKEVLPDTTYSHLDSVLSSWGMSIELFKSFRPWMVAMQISAIAIERTGFSSEWGIEYQLLDQAVMSGKEVISLESPKTQIEALAKPSDTLGVYYLQSTLKEVAQIKTMISQVGLAWLSGNDSLLCHLLHFSQEVKNEREVEMEEELNKYIYHERNVGMVNQIETFLKENKKYFIAVGVAHLIEEDNVIQGLEKKGFKIQSY